MTTACWAWALKRCLLPPRSRPPPAGPASAAPSAPVWIGWPGTKPRAARDLDAVSGCFGELMAELFDYRQDHWSPELRSIGFHLGKYIYLLDAYDDLARDERKGAYNPLRTLSREPGYEEEMREIFELLLANCARSFERLPCVEDVDLLRNILYSGVWLKYHCKMQRRTKPPDPGGFP